MSLEDTERLRELFESYGPEVLLIYLKGECIRTAATMRKVNGSSSMLALPYDFIAEGLKRVLEASTGRIGEVKN